MALHGRAANQTEPRIARRLELRPAFLRDVLDVVECNQAAQSVRVIHDQQFVDAQMFSEKFIGPRDRIFAEFFVVDGLHLRARLEGFGHLPLGVPRLDHVSGQQPEQFSLFIHNRKSAEPEFLLVNHLDDIADELVRRYLDGVLDQSMHVVFHAADFRKLVVFRQIVMNQAQSAVQRHGNRHARFGHGIHVRGNHRNIQTQMRRQLRIQLGIARKNLRIKRRQRNIVKRQANRAAGGKKVIRGRVKRAVEVNFALCCHVGT